MIHIQRVLSTRPLPKSGTKTIPSYKTISGNKPEPLPNLSMGILNGPGNYPGFHGKFICARTFLTADLL